MVKIEKSSPEDSAKMSNDLCICFVKTDVLFQKKIHFSVCSVFILPVKFFTLGHLGTSFLYPVYTVTLRVWIQTRGGGVT